jgi:hypothetical protein
MSVIDNQNISFSQAKHVLLISPLTFSYHTIISETLCNMGYQVTWWNNRASDTTWYKVLLRISPKIVAKFSENSFKKKLIALDSETVSHVLVIKGEGLSKQTICNIKETCHLASMGLYLWDSAENVKTVHDKTDFFDSVASFDPHDAKIFNWAYRPLFWRKISVPTEKNNNLIFDWCFIGTVHSDRHRVIHKLRQRYGSQFNSFVFAYFQSPLILFARKLVDCTLWASPKGTLSTTPMSAIDVSNIVAQSKAVLDIEHPKQRGFTMRTIETLMAGKKLITTNKHILHSDIFHSSRVLVIDRFNPEICTNFFTESFQEIPESLKNYYSCEGWALELLQLQDAAKNRKVTNEKIN